MTVKVEIKESAIHPGTKVIYTNNCVTDELVNAVTEVLKKDEEVRVSFDVDGETLHSVLSNQLKSQLKDKFPNSYSVSVGRYECLVHIGFLND